MSRVMEEKDYAKEKVEWGAWKRLLRVLWLEKKLIRTLVICMLVMSLADVVLPLLDGYAVDTFVGHQQDMSTIVKFIVAYVAVILVFGVCVYVFLSVTWKMEGNFSKSLRMMSFEKLQEQSFSYFDKTSNGWILSRMTGDISTIAEIMSWSIIDIAWGSATIIGVLVVMLIINWKLALISIAAVPFIFMISLYFQKRILLAQRDARKFNSKITASLAEGIAGAQTTKTLVVEDVNYENFTNLSENMNKASLRANNLNARYQPAIFVVSSIASATLIVVGGQMMLDGLVQVGILVSFIRYANLFFEPLRQFARILAELQLAQASAERVITLLDEPIAITDRPDVIEKYGTLLNENKEVFEDIKGNITFDHVNFHYYPEEPILKDFNLDVKAGEMVALVGATGSGKSTIVNLLCRFYEPVSGQILVDGTDANDRSVAWMHSHLGYVLQTPNLFSGTILDNIRYGRPDASVEEVIEIAKLVGAHDFIMKTSKGYDSEVGEGGALLSTGEKQLLSFARAMLVDPSIVVLDEATSSIDTESELMIQSAIHTLLDGRTSFVVAHRLSTIVGADKIIVMDGGEILEQGTHTQLMELHGKYYELFTSQYRSLKEQAWCKE